MEYCSQGESFGTYHWKESAEAVRIDFVAVSNTIHVLPESVSIIEVDYHVEHLDPLPSGCIIQRLIASGGSAARRRVPGYSRADAEDPDKQAVVSQLLSRLT